MVYLRLYVSLLALLIVTTFGSSTASGQFSTTLTWAKTEVPAPAPANTFEYTVQGGFSGNYPAGNKEVAGNYEAFKKVAGVRVAVPGTSATFSAGINNAGGHYTFTTAQFVRGIPPAGGDEYEFRLSWQLVPAVGVRGPLTTTTSPVTTVLP